MFVKELTMYIDYLKNEIKGVSEEITAGQIKNGIRLKQSDGTYYQSLFVPGVAAEK
jgi:hypothetical protein